MSKPLNVTQTSIHSEYEQPYVLKRGGGHSFDYDQDKFSEVLDEVI